MTREDALKRLQQCRDNQPEACQVIVSRDIVDALLGDQKLYVCENCRLLAVSRP